MYKENYKRIQQILVDNGFDIGKSGENKNGVDGLPGRKTFWALTQYLRKRYKDLGHRLPNSNGLTWLRMDGVFTDKFSDFVCVWYRGSVVQLAVATTKPGKYWVSNPLTVGGITGTGCQKEGQTKDSHKYESTGKSKWGSKAGYFIQVKSVIVYRDGNKDNKLDKNITQVAPTSFGFFFHAMGRGFSIWNWSAGCMGTPLEEWLVKINPYFSDGDVIDQTIIEIK